MSWLKTVSHEILGLFVDDLSFTIAILVWLTVLWWLLPRLPIAGAWQAVILFAGMIAILVESVLRGARRHV